MKLTISSDLHLEFGDVKIIPGDILLVAGDTLEIDHISRRRYQEFFQSISKDFNLVFVICGNHEHYEHNFQNTVEKYKEGVKDFSNITVLDNELIYLPNNYYLWGGTLWTDFSAWPGSEVMCRKFMNDFHCIRYYDHIYHGYHTFTIEDCRQENAKALTSLKHSLELVKEKLIVMTHHAPSKKSIHHKYMSGIDANMNGGFCNDLDSLIIANPQIKYWFHGHTHNSFDYWIGNTHVIANPRGYRNENEYFNTGYVVDLP